jgi:hypothetical protein
MASLPSASQLYRRFTALVQRWPADPSKGPDRDLRPALERTVEQMFPRSIVPPTAAKVFLNIYFVKQKMEKI